MFLIQQLDLLQDVLSHLSKASASFLSTPQDQTVLVVSCADAIQRFSHGLRRKALLFTSISTSIQASKELSRNNLHFFLAK